MPKKQDSKIKLSIAGFFFLSAVRFFRHRYPFAYKWLGGHVGCLGDKAWRDPPSTPHCGLLGNKALPFLLSTTNSKKKNASAPFRYWERPDS